MVKIIPRIGGLCLDLGCYDEKDQELIEDLGYEWIGTDLFHNPQINIVHDAHHLPFSDSTFNLVVSIALLEHLENPWMTFSEINRILKENGYVFITSAFLEPYHGKNYGSYYHMTWRGLKNLFEDCGFKIMTIEPGWNVLEMISKHFIPIKKLQMLFQYLSRLYIRFLFNKGKRKRTPRELYLAYAGSYYCLAKKYSAKK
jgi:SAM-dependent methyltransferase